MLPPDDQLLGLTKPGLILELKRVDQALTESEIRAEALSRENADLKAKLQAAAEKARKEKRSAAPFSKGEGKPNPKPPGRKPGAGKFERRQAPEILPGDEVVDLSAPLEETTCPKCSTVLNITTEIATTVDIPEQPRRIIKRWERQIGTCPHCNERVLGTHPELPASQTGATLHRVGENFMGSCHWLHYRLGMSQRRAVEALATMTGIRITQSAAVQHAERLCAAEGAATRCCDALLPELRKAPAVNTDDSSWVISLKQAFVMGFFTATIKLFFITLQHRSEEVLAILTRAFMGFLITDRGSSYDAKKLNWIRYQKCLAHLLRNIKEASEGKNGAALKFLQELASLLREGIRLWNEYHAGAITRKHLKEQAVALDAKLKHHLRERRMADPDAARILAGIGDRHDNGQLILFLNEPKKVAPTNNMAERDLRSIIILRKNSQCSKNQRGADATAKMVSLFATIEARKLVPIPAYKEILQTGRMPAPCMA